MNYVSFAFSTAVTMKNVFAMLRLVALVRIDVSEECSSYIIMVTRTNEYSVTTQRASVASNGYRSS
jgi:hypothetical protein